MCESVAGLNRQPGETKIAGRYDYIALNPAGSVVSTRFASGRSTSTGLFDGAGSAVDCQPGSAGSSADNAWCLLLQQSSPTNGHWQVRMTPNGGSSQISAVGIRARDTVTGRDLNVYTRSFVHYGNQTVSARRDYTVANGDNAFYPYVTAGCSLRSYEFDSDNDNSQFPHL